MPAILGDVNLARPLDLFASASHVDVAVALARASTPLSGREAARAAKRSQQRTQDVLNDLTSQGLVLQTGSERRSRYELNREHVAAPVVVAMTELRLALVERMRAAIGDWKRPPVSAVLFGSAARGDGDNASDVDVLVVRPAHVSPDDAEWQSQVDGLSARIRAWSGNLPSVLELGEDDIPDLVQRSPAVVADLREQGIGLFGAPVRRLLRTAP